MATKNTRHARVRLTPLELSAIRGVLRSLRVAEVLKPEDFIATMPNEKAAGEFVAKLKRLGLLSEGDAT